MSIKFKKLNELAYTPTRGSIYSAGYDLRACYGGEIPPHEIVKFGTGLAIEIPEGYFGGVYARSGLATKHGLRPATCTSIIDSDYRGELIVPLYNDSEIPYEIQPGERIAQLVIQPYSMIDLDEVDDLSETERGEGGFGSTGR